MINSSFSEARLIEKYSKHIQTKLLVDVGAHRGSFSKIYAKKAWRIIAFEPEEENRNILTQELRNYHQVTISSLAISNQEKLTSFYKSSIHHGIHSLKPFHKTHKKSGKVQTIKLDTFLKNHHISKVGILKIDIEGADFLALKSISLNKIRPELIMVEYMDSRSIPNYKYSLKVMTAYMRKYNYTAFITEWEPIKEYYSDIKKTPPHKFKTWTRNENKINDSSWGNIIFIENKNANTFEKYINRYVASLVKVNTLRNNHQYIFKSVIYIENILSRVKNKLIRTYL